MVAAALAFSYSHRNYCSSLRRVLPWETFLNGGVQWRGWPVTPPPSHPLPRLHCHVLPPREASAQMALCEVSAQTRDPWKIPSRGQRPVAPPILRHLKTRAAHAPPHPNAQAQADRQPADADTLPNGDPCHQRVTHHYDLLHNPSDPAAPVFMWSNGRRDHLLRGCEHD